MNDSKNVRQRTQLLKELREQHKKTVSRTQDRLKSQKKIHKEIKQIIREAPKTVPEISAQTNLPPHIVLWNLTALKKYGAVSEAGRDGEYFQYSLSKEGK